jgi:hypothetical protein
VILGALLAFFSGYLLGKFWFYLIFKNNIILKIFAYQIKFVSCLSVYLKNK